MGYHEVRRGRRVRAAGRTILEQPTRMADTPLGLDARYGETEVDGELKRMEQVTRAVIAGSAGRFDYLPVGLFGSIMGLTGLSVAWRLAHEHFGAPESISRWIGVVALILFLAVSCGYAVKAATAPQAVRAEFRHPVAGNLFATILIDLLLLPILMAPYNLLMARIIWIAGVIGMTTFAVFIVSRWLSQRQQLAHATPPWLVPVVGMLNVPLAMPALQLSHAPGVAIAGLAIGLFFTIPLFTLVFARLLFVPALPDELQPSLIILLAPFAVGTSTYAVTTSRIDLFASVLFALTMFMLVALLGRMRHLAACCPFRVSWWSVSFPLAAAAIAGLRVARASPGDLTDLIAIALLALSSVVVAFLLARSLLGIARGELRALSGEHAPAAESGT